MPRLNAPYPGDRRYPIEPLERLIRVRLLERGQQPGVKPMADELGEDPNTIRRARNLGLGREAAERLADAAGYLAVEVWPEMIHHDIEDLTRKCEAPDCPVEFVAPAPAWGQKRRRYCCRACQIRTNNRKRYQTDEATRERRKAYRRRYRQEVAEAARRRAERRAA